MKKKYRFFVTSDIHGEYKALMEALQEAGYDPSNPEHFFVDLGDSFDRGPSSKDIYRYFKGLPKDRRMFVKGNHDIMFQEYLDKGMDGEFVLFNILHNGLGATINSFGCLEFGRNPTTVEILNDVCFYIKREYPELKSFLADKPLWFETDNFVMVHAGLNPELVNWQRTDEHYALWDIKDAHRRVPNCVKTIIFGHYHTDLVAEQARKEGDTKITPITTSGVSTRRGAILRNYGNTDNFSSIYLQNANKVAIDGCTNLTKKVNVLVFEDTITSPEDAKVEEQAANTAVISSINVTTNPDGSVLYTTTYPGEIDGAATTVFTARDFTIDMGAVEWPNIIYR